MRKYPLVSGHLYHVLTRSIAKYKVFNSSEDYDRIIEALRLYQYNNFDLKISDYKKYSDKQQKVIYNSLRSDNRKSTDIIAYCIMPTHIHLILRQIEDLGISWYVSKLLNSYTRHFNCIHKRKGPLWEGRFKNILINSDEQLLHLTRYLHLNPSSAGLVKKPEQWNYSSLREYISRKKNADNITVYHDLIDMSPKDYRIFIKENITYQRKLSIIKHLTLDDYSG